jgi:S1-C subfamily serine protease
MRRKEDILKKILFIISFIFACQNIMAQQKMLLENEKNSISVFQLTADSIVNVSNIKITKSFFDMDATEVQSGMGSGFIWDKNGFLVTNFHVVDGGDSFQVAFKDDKKQYKAKLIGADPKKDIAVLKLEEMPKEIKPISVGDSKGLLVGQKTLAIGNPLGLDHSLTTGIVSALDRKIPGYGGVSISGMIQTDAAINPGNSGGALLDSQGKLIGMNTMIFNAGGSQSSAGLGFAIPVDTIKQVVPQLIKFGKVNRPGLGIAILEPQYAYRYGVNEGVMIKFVDPKGPASKAGLRGITRDRRGQYYFGDIITGINNLTVKNFDDLFTAIDTFQIGEKVKVKYLRENKENTVTVTLIQI